MLAGDVEGTLKHYKWFDRVFSDYIGELGQYLCWILAFYRSGDLKKAYAKFLQTLFMNPHVIARVIGIDYKLPYKPDSNIPTKEWAEWVPDEFYDQDLRANPKERNSIYLEMLIQDLTGKSAAKYQQRTLNRDISAKGVP
jgi:hypothetical protein